MKRFITMFVAAMAAVVMAKAEVEFAYEAGADIVSSYIWRGQYNGGLSLQPEGLVGFDANDGALSFRAGVWASIGASDWKFMNFQSDAPMLAQTPARKLRAPSFASKPTRPSGCKLKPPLYWPRQMYELTMSAPAS